MNDFQTIDSAELQAVTGGFLDQLLAGGLGGALQGFGKSLASTGLDGLKDGSWLRGALSGGLEGAAGVGSQLIQQSGQPQQQQQQPQQQAA